MRPKAAAFSGYLSGMQGAYEYRLPGRRPATLFGLTVATALLVLAGYGAAPWFIWAIWGGVSEALAWSVFRNPVSGCRIDRARLVWFEGSRETGIRLDEIEHVELTGWSDGPDTCLIHLADGKMVSPPSLCLPPGTTFERVLAARSVPVSRS